MAAGSAGGWAAGSWLSLPELSLSEELTATVAGGAASCSASGCEGSLLDSEPSEEEDEEAPLHTQASLSSQSRQTVKGFSRKAAVAARTQAAALKLRAAELQPSPLEQVRGCARLLGLQPAAHLQLLCP